MNVNLKLNTEKEKVICYKIMIVEKMIKHHYINKPFFKFGLYYKKWKELLCQYENIIFDLYNELSKLIDNH